MSLDKIIAGVIIGAAAGVVVGMMVPEERKGEWVKEKQDKVRERWNTYDKKKAELEKEKQAFINRRKKKI